ncbi:MAG: glycosyltransferase [Leptolyngbya sp. SIO1D8]|nr:glycosyltransferase [Leptolyngbya sp. SIO1D8]
MYNIGVVVIGRNEGERLIRCLKSLQTQLPSSMPIIYVDSGSTDGSNEAAKTLGVNVVNLDMSIPFTMARGRNTGLNYLLEHYPNLEYVQFIDGDCELLPHWLDKALAFIAKDETLAAVCGRRRERFPEASLYNRLADMEWNTLIGEAKACGGDALMRVAALKQVDGYKPTMIAGEEPEMCIRLREKGWRIWRIEADMTLHDAAIFQFGQWWKRSVRGGWAIAEGYVLHGSPPEKYMVKEHRSGWLWGLLIPLISIGFAPLTYGISLILLGSYGILGWKIYCYRRQVHNDLPQDARLYAYYCTLSKGPQIIGQAKYWLNRLKGEQATLIEYKNTSSDSNSSLANVINSENFSGLQHD